MKRQSRAANIDRALTEAEPTIRRHAGAIIRRDPALTVADLEDVRQMVRLVCWTILDRRTSPDGVCPPLDDALYAEIWIRGKAKARNYAMSAANTGVTGATCVIRRTRSLAHNGLATEAELTSTPRAVPIGAERFPHGRSTEPDLGDLVAERLDYERARQARLEGQPELAMLEWGYVYAD